MTPSSTGSKTIPAKNAKAKWDDDEIRRMVELKVSGLSHREVAVSFLPYSSRVFDIILNQRFQEKLGRGQGSVENKYGRMMQMDYWKDHSTWYESSLRQKNKQKGDDDCQDPSPKRQCLDDSP